MWICQSIFLVSTSHCFPAGQTRIDVVQFSDLPDPTPSSVCPAQQPQLSVTLSKPKEEGPVVERETPATNENKPSCVDSKDSNDKLPPQAGQEETKKTISEESVPKTESWVIVGEGDNVISSSNSDTAPAQDESGAHSQSGADDHTSVSVRQAWSEGQDAKKEELSDISKKPHSDDEPGPILVQDIEEEPAVVRSKESIPGRDHTPVTTVPQTASSEDVFSTPTGPSPSVSHCTFYCWIDDTHTHTHTHTHTVSRVIL